MKTLLNRLSVLSLTLIPAYGVSQDENHAVAEAQRITNLLSQTTPAEPVVSRLTPERDSPTVFKGTWKQQLSDTLSVDFRGFHVTFKGGSLNPIAFEDTALERKLLGSDTSTRVRAGYSHVEDLVHLVATRLSEAGFNAFESVSTNAQEPDAEGSVPAKAIRIEFRATLDSYPLPMFTEALVDGETMRFAWVHQSRFFKNAPLPHAVISEHEALRFANVENGAVVTCSFDSPIVALSNNRLTVDARAYLNKLEIPLSYYVEGSTEFAIVDAGNGDILARGTKMRLLASQGHAATTPPPAKMKSFSLAKIKSNAQAKEAQETRSKTVKTVGGAMAALVVVVALFLRKMSYRKSN
ncbi:MAG: hypothetical protein ABL949_06360 [Fimbriimonadaceae bacterium]